MHLVRNLEEVRQNINRALEKSGRKTDKVKVVAVSKTVSEDRILEVYKTGHKVFGENKVQEWQQKKAVLPTDCEWHIIGRLQTNKVKYLDDSVDLIHSLDRFPLLEKLNAEGEKRNILWETLVQVNVANDESKAGLDVNEVADFIKTVKEFPYVKISGLMTIGALEASLEETRGFFRELREIRDKLIREEICPKEQLPHLSMGMSQDYEIAVEEGATIVRVGSLIFGDRNYH